MLRRYTIKPWITVALALMLMCAVPADGRTRRASSANRTQKTVKTDRKAKQAEIKQTEAELAAKRREAERQLNSLNLLSAQIDECSADIAQLSATVDSVNRLITGVSDSIAVLESRLRGLKSSYGSALRRSRSRRSHVSDLAFIFSSGSIRQAYHRNRLLQQQVKWQSRKVAELKAAKTELDAKQVRLTALRESNARSLDKLGVRRADLQAKRSETGTLIANLKSEQTALDHALAQQRREAKALDDELSRLIAEEQARQERLQREREAEEARRKAEAEEARRKAEEAEAQRKAAEAKQKAETEAAEAKRQDERKEQERLEKEQRKQAQQQAKEKKKQERKSAKRKKGKATQEQTAAAETKTPVADTAEAKPAKTPAQKALPAARLTAGFAGSQGSLRWPVDGTRTVVKRFGRRKHPTLQHVETENSGIDIETASGAAVKCVYDGEVALVCAPAGFNNVIVVRHGDYFTVYANLGSINVRTGDVVKAGSTLGTVYKDAGDNNRSVLHFEVRLKQQKQDPEGWLR